MKVRLSHRRNPDTGGYWDPPVDPGRPRWVPIKDFAAASSVCLAFIARNGLGISNWNGGAIKNDKGKQIAYVTYGGRVCDGKLCDWESGVKVLWP